MQTAFDHLEQRINRKRTGSLSASRRAPVPPAEAASEGAIDNPVFSPAPQGPTERFEEAERPTQTAVDQSAVSDVAASSSSAAQPQSKDGERADGHSGLGFTCNCLYCLTLTYSEKPFVSCLHLQHVSA